MLVAYTFAPHCKTNGRIYKTNGRIYRTKGKIYKTNGKIYKTNGRIYKTNGRIYKTNRRMYKTNGRIYRTKGKIYKTNRKIYIRPTEGYIPTSVYIVPKAFEYLVTPLETRKHGQPITHLRDSDYVFYYTHMLFVEHAIPWFFCCVCCYGGDKIDTGGWIRGGREPHP